jgi:predicted ATP-binding protein involved in virulence
MFSEKEIHLNERFTLVIGENGTGKTTLLEALRVGVGGFLAGLEGVVTQNIRKDDVRVEWERVGDATYTKLHQTPVVIECKGTIQNHELSWRITKETYLGRTTRSQAKDILACAKELQDQIVKHKNQDVILPVISFQSAGRLFSQKKEKWVDPFKREDLSRFLGYTDCLEPESNIKLFVNWLRKMTTIKVQKNKNIGELDAVVQTVKELIQFLLEEEHDISFGYDFEEEEVIVEFGGKRDALRVMSAGFRTVIGMVADIAYRMALLNPHLRQEAVKQTPGVVLIDELDLHLHPKWQWKIVDCLKTIFPKVQFIATTHAPIVISSCADAEIIDLHEHSQDEIERTEKPPYGWLIEDILTYKMDSHGRNQQVEQDILHVQSLQMKKLRGALSTEELETLKQKARRLSELLPESDPAVMMAKIEAIAEVAGGQEDGQS